MLIRYNSHASITLTSKNKKKLITDPWFYEPIYGGMMWQYPRSNLSIAEYTNSDYIVISHIHPDHFCTKTLNHFDNKKTKILIPDNESMHPMSDYLEKKEFQYHFIKNEEKFNLDDTFEVTFYCSDNNIDSVQVISEKDSQESLFNMNDCFLSNKQLDFISKKHLINHAMVFFMGVGPYPGSFDLPLEKKLEIIENKEKSDYKRALNIIKRLNVSSYTAYSNDMTWLRRPDLVNINGSLKSKFYKFVNKLIPSIKSIPLESGDTYCLSSKNKDIKSSLIEDKAIFIKQIQKLKSKSFFTKQINQIEKAETSFLFNKDLFYEEVKIIYSIFLKELKIKNLNPNKNYPDHLNQSFKKEKYVIKLFLLPESYTAIFTFHYEDEILYLSFNENEENSLHIDLNLQLPSYLWSALQNNFYSSEDLMNCRFFIQRDGEYTQIEDSFWNAFSKFKRGENFKINDYQQLSLSN